MPALADRRRSRQQREKNNTHSVEFEVTYIAVQADFATWSATRTQGGFDIRTFAVKAKPTTHIENMRPGMSVLVDWDLIGK